MMRNMKEMRWLRFALLPATLFAASTAWAVGAVNPYPISDNGIDPILTSGNPTCQDLGYSTGVKVDPPLDGTNTVTLPGTGNTITYTADVAAGTLIAWSSTAGVGVNAVIMKGGQQGAYVYPYDPASHGDGYLYTPINPGSEKPAGISHIDFCYSKLLTIGKTAETSFDRTWTWTIDKSADKGTDSSDPLKILPGSFAVVNYTVTVTAGAPTDSNWAVEGDITIVNTWDVAAGITGVTDLITPGDIAPAVACGVTFPHALAAGATLECSYAATLPDATQRLNTATVTTDGPIGGGTATADVIFGSSPTNKIDECVSVTDAFNGGAASALGTACAGDSPKSFTYSHDIQQTEACGTSQVSNTAVFTTDTTGTTGEASVTVYVDQEFCQSQGGGCTLTIGYWKTHSEFGPAPYDTTWASLSNGASTAFFLSGKTWYQVFWTPPAGNAYYNLAHQYMGALLNGANGANTSSVTSALSFAFNYFNTHAAGTAAPTGSLRNQVLQAAAALASFNEGVTGPGHCDE